MKKSSNLKERLIAVQAELKAPKAQYNSFGRYKYRSCEDILEAVKPLLAKHGVLLTISDSIQQIGERYYLVAEIRLMHPEGDEQISVRAMAREEELKKGMDGSQITGTASSYARKYALSAAFLLDDTKDVDAHDNREHGQSAAVSAPVPQAVKPAARGRSDKPAQAHASRLAEDYVIRGDTPQAGKRWRDISDDKLVQLADNKQALARLSAETRAAYWQVYYNRGLSPKNKAYEPAAPPSEPSQPTDPSIVYDDPSIVYDEGSL